MLAGSSKHYVSQQDRGRGVATLLTATRRIPAAGVLERAGIMTDS